MQYNNCPNNSAEVVSIILNNIETIKKYSYALEVYINSTYPLLNKIRTPEEETKLKDLITNFRLAEWEIESSSENIKNMYTTHLIPFRYQTIGDMTIDIQTERWK